MSLLELIPTLQGMRERLRSAHDKVSALEKDAEVQRVLPGWSLGIGDSLLRTAEELGGQLRTAERPFTLAVVGEFKVGKSTLLNALLGLSGQNGLSAKDEPDTACSTLLRMRGAGDPEARLHFLDGRVEDTSWAHARNLTSQVWLDTHPTDHARARQLQEVEYFVCSPLLMNGLMLNDLPGTGSRYWREHTELTHRRMKEADAILWVVGEKEPSADSRRDLDVLAECAQHVYPIVNVLEDPLADPPLERSEANVKHVVSVLERQFRHCFSPELSHPLEVSAKVIEQQRSRATQDARILTEAGWDALLQLVGDIATNAEPSQWTRVRRICGAATALGQQGTQVAATANGKVRTALQAVTGASTQAGLRLDEVSSIRQEVRGRIRALARDRASFICGNVAERARLFIEEVLQIDNWTDLRHALTAKGRERLQTDLKDRFLGKHLELKQEPNWLTELGRTFSDDVQEVVLPLWRQLLHKLPERPAAVGSTGVPAVDVTQLSQALLQAVNAVIRRLLGIAGVAAVLAAIPGGQILDAIGVLSLMIASAFTDPLANARRRAVERARLQTEAQQFEFQNRFVDAGMEGNKAVESEVRRELEQDLDQVEGVRSRLQQVNHQLETLQEDLLNAMRAFDMVLNGRAS